jgi:hypothetical protein
MLTAPLGWLHDGSGDDGESEEHEGAEENSGDEGSEGDQNRTGSASARVSNALPSVDQSARRAASIINELSGEDPSENSDGGAVRTAGRQLGETAGRQIGEAIARSLGGNADDEESTDG